MDTITISQKEYTKLKQQALAYQKMAKSLFSAVIQDPIHEVAEDFRATGLYSKAFLQDLEQGLRKSSYLKRKAKI
jgi:hypothetical protein